MKKHITYSILSFFLFISSFCFAQDSTKTKFDINGDTLRSVFRPRIGMGTGVMTYYGEIQDYQKGFVPTVNRFGGTIYANAPINRMFNLEFSATYAKIAANERTLDRNLNFESRIRMGTVYLYYNFYPLFQSNRARFHPYIGTGFSSFEFLSKSDMFDRQGNQYFYWSDGSIMNMDENDPNSGNAIPLTRDYTYETDLRELNADNLGKYREQSFAIPVTIGAEWHLSPRWDFRIAAIYNFTFTDLIDNISTAGEGIRAGDKNLDRLLFSTVSLSYDLVLGKPKGEDGLIDPLDEQGIPLYAGWEQNDFDNDGVIDALDKCAGTPLEALVDSSGCPLDGDQDGVPDYLDDEPDTDLGSYVDEYGVTITEEDFEERARRFYDSTGYEHDFAEIRTEVILRREKISYVSAKDRKRQAGLKYVVIIGKEKKDVTVNDLHKYLGYKDYSTFAKGDTVYYTLGEFDNIADAVAAKEDLEERGVEVQDISRNREGSETIISVDQRVIDKVERVIERDSSVVTPDKTVISTEQFYRIQLGAFRDKIDSDMAFPGLDVVFARSDVDGLVRYYTGSYPTYEEATEAKNKILANGVESAFVLAYEKETRITLKEAGVPSDALPTGYTEEKELETFVEPRENTVAEESFNANQVRYRIQLAYFEDEIPVETVDILYNIKQILPVKGADGSTTYYSAPFETAEARDAALIEYKQYGLDDMQPVVEYKGIYYTPEEFNQKFGK